MSWKPGTMVSEEGNKYLAKLFEHLQPQPGLYSQNTADQQSNPGPSYGIIGPVQYIPDGGNIYTQIPQDLIEHFGSNMVLIYSVPFENVQGAISANVNSNVSVDNRARLNIGIERNANYCPRSNPVSEENYVLSEKDIQNLRDHFSGKIKLDSNFIQRIYDRSEHFHMLKSRGYNIYQKPSKIHPWTKWVGTRCPKVEPKSHPKFKLRSKHMPTWQESDPMRIHDSSNSETEVEDLPNCVSLGQESDAMRIHDSNNSETQVEDLPNCVSLGQESDAMKIHNKDNDCKNSEPQADIPYNISPWQEFDSLRRQVAKSSETQSDSINNVSTFQESDQRRLQDGIGSGVQAVYQKFYTHSNCAKLLPFPILDPNSSQTFIYREITPDQHQFKKL